MCGFVGGKVIQDWIIKGLLHRSKETELHLRKQGVTEQRGNCMHALRRWCSCTQTAGKQGREQVGAEIMKKGFRDSKTWASDEAVRDEKDRDFDKAFR